MTRSLLSEQLLSVARNRLSGSFHSEANLRRATSDLYYAVFHAVCEALVEPLGAAPASRAFKETYRSLYRGVDHGNAERVCREIIKERGLSQAITSFAKQFVSLKNKREDADYDPLQRFAVSTVKTDLATTETRLREFWAAPMTERSAFACMVALRRRR